MATKEKAGQGRKPFWAVVDATWSPEECAMRQGRALRTLAEMALAYVDKQYVSCQAVEKSRRPDGLGQDGAKHNYSLAI